MNNNDVDDHSRRKLGAEGADSNFAKVQFVWVVSRAWIIIWKLSLFLLPAGIFVAIVWILDVDMHQVMRRIEKVISKIDWLNASQLEKPQSPPTFGHLFSGDIAPLAISIGAGILLLIIAYMSMLAILNWPNIRFGGGQKARAGANDPLKSVGGISDPLYQQIEENTDQHLRLLDKYTEFYSSRGFVNSAQIAAGELFTEKAQIHLTERAKEYYFWAVFSAICAAFSLCVGVLILTNHETATFIGSIYDSMRSIDQGSSPWPTVAVYVTRGLAITAFFAGALYFFASLSRAYFHEGTVLLNRRHATRLGRLYLLIKYGDRTAANGVQVETGQICKPLTDARDAIRWAMHDKAKDLSPEQIAALPGWVLDPLVIDTKELEEAFGWNLSQDSAFKDIKPEKMSTSLYVKMVEALGRVAERTKSQASEGSNN